MTKCNDKVNTKTIGLGDDMVEFRGPHCAPRSGWDYCNTTGYDRRVVGVHPGREALGVIAWDVTDLAPQCLDSHCIGVEGIVRLANELPLDVTFAEGLKFELVVFPASNPEHSRLCLQKTCQVFGDALLCDVQRNREVTAALDYNFRSLLKTLDAARLGQNFQAILQLSRRQFCLFERRLDTS